jgi:hypothetical protein
MSALLPDTLTHYYSAARGPLRSLSSIPIDQAEALMEDIHRQGLGFASRRPADYLVNRRGVEKLVRDGFIRKGGVPCRDTPHYFILGECAWVKTWYPDGRDLRLPLALFDPMTVSFTYGDSYPAMRFQDGKPYRAQVYTLAELPGLVAEFGLPQDWNPTGALGPERYIEAQVWQDERLVEWLHDNRRNLSDE